MKCLVQRVQKLANNQKFSVRDKKLLIRLVKNRPKEDQIDYEAVIYHFPGKSVEQLDKICKELLRGSKE